MRLINTHGDISSWTKGLNIGLSLHLYLYFGYASSEVSGEYAHTHLNFQCSLMRYHPYNHPYYFLAYKLYIYHVYCTIYNKVRKRAKIRNQYNQAPHLTQDTSGKVTNWNIDYKFEVFQLDWLN